MARPLQAFVEEVATPLLSGGAVQVGAPLSTRDRELMLGDAGALYDEGLLRSREASARRLVPEPVLPEPGAQELSLWMGIYNLLALDHPDTVRQWTRPSTWRRVEAQTRALLSYAHPTDMGEALTRHLAVESLLQLERHDTVLKEGEIERRYLGRRPPRVLFGLVSVPVEALDTEVVRWAEQQHGPVVDRLLEDVMWVSPLTSLLHPLRAPKDWSALHAVDFLVPANYARAVVYAWARSEDWISVGGRLAGGLLRALDVAADVFERPDLARRPPAPVGLDDDVEIDDDLIDAAALAEAGAPLALPGAVVDDSPAAVATVLGALIHLHVLKVMEFDARIGIGAGSRDWAVQAFLALPLVLRALSPVLGRPLSTDDDPGLLRRWEEHTDHLRGLIPRTVVQNLLAAVVAPIVEGGRDSRATPRAAVETR